MTLGCVLPSPSISPCRMLLIIVIAVAPPIISYVPLLTSRDPICLLDKTAILANLVSEWRTSAQTTGAGRPELAVPCH